MEYKYLLEETSNKNISFDEIIGEQGNYILNIICYCVETNYKYPFLQFMMEKIPYCNNIVNEQLIFPYIFIKKSSCNIQDLVLERVRTGLKMLGCNHNLNEDMYKGIIFRDNCLSSYALINITGIDINGLNFTRQSTNWFVVSSEIINNQNVLNIPVDKDVIDLFTDVRQIGHLINTQNDEYFILPDVVYSVSEKKQAEFKSVFGNVKTKEYDNCGEYYFFYRSFYDIFCSNKYITSYINRYALFVEGKLYLENNKDFMLNDETIYYFYPEPCIIICYSGEHNIKPDILVKDYNNFVCLSYHILDKNCMKSNKKQYNDSLNKKQYMIA
jgi:hypothetical protein